MPSGSSSKHPEVDLEAATRLGARAYWMTSHGRNPKVVEVAWPIVVHERCHALRTQLGDRALAACRAVGGSWKVCGGATCLVLFLALAAVLPHYNRRFALRDCLGEIECSEASIACYPKSWDSVQFYLRRTDVRAYSEDQRAQLLEDLGRQSRTLLVTRSGRSLEALIRDLPAARE